MTPDFTHSPTERPENEAHGIFYAVGARTGRERAVRDDLRAIGAWAWVAEEIQHKVFPGSKKPKLSSRPMWPGYVFAQLDPWQFFESRNIKYLHPTKLALNVMEVRALMGSLDEIEAQNAADVARAERGEIVNTYKPGDRMEILAGAFKDRAGALARVINRDGGFSLQMYLDGATQFPVTVDAGDVRKAG